MRELLENDQVQAVVNRCFSLSEVAGALQYLGEGRACGKAVLTTSA